MTVVKTITTRNIQTPDGFLLKASSVKILEYTDKNVKVSDMTGRIFWLVEKDLVLQLIFIYKSTNNVEENVYEINL